MAGSRLGRVWPSLVALFGTVAVVVALLMLFGGDAGSGDDDDGGDVTAGNTEPPDAGGEDGGDDPGDEGDETAAPPGDPVTAPAELRTPVGILNGTSVAGLAARAQERLEAGGWSVPAVDSTDRDIEASTIYYPQGMDESAEALRAQFPEITRVEPTVAGLAQDRLVVILVDDYAEAVGDTG